MAGPDGFWNNFDWRGWRDKAKWTEYLVGPSKGERRQCGAICNILIFSQWSPSSDSHAGLIKGFDLRSLPYSHVENSREPIKNGKCLMKSVRTAITR